VNLIGSAVVQASEFIRRDESADKIALSTLSLLEATVGVCSRCFQRENLKKEVTFQLSIRMYVAVISKQAISYMV